MQITNVTTLKFTVSSKAVLCELQPLQIDLNYKVSDPKEATYPLETIGLSEASVEQVKNLLMEHKYWGTDIGLCTFVQCRINLIDETPFNQKKSTKHC